MPFSNLAFPYKLKKITSKLLIEICKNGAVLTTAYALNKNIIEASKYHKIVNSYFGTGTWL